MDMHGKEDKVESGSLLTSDLPKLMRSYKPGMRLESVKAYEMFDDDEAVEEYIVGLQATLTGERSRGRAGEKVVLNVTGIPSDLSEMELKFGEND